MDRGSLGAGFGGWLGGLRGSNFDPAYGVMWDRLASVRALEAETRRARRRPGVSRRAGALTVG